MKINLNTLISTFKALPNIFNRQPSRVPVDSSVIKSVGYRNGTLEIEFKSGRVYRYFGVSERTHSRLMDAPSKGAFFNAHIRNNYVNEAVL